MIDRHYTKLTCQPIEFIQNNRLDYLSGNIVKYVSRFYTINRADANKKDNITRIKFYLSRAILEYDRTLLDKNYKPFLTRVSERRVIEYCKNNSFDSFQTNVLLDYFKATYNNSQVDVKILLDKLELYL